MPSRRFHQKRRHGCGNCKRRKHRCGEERPSCHNCTRLGTRCSYLDSDPPEAPTTAQQVSRASPTMQLPMAFGASDRTEAELMHHYVNSACFTTTDDQGLFPSWQVTIPQLALSSSYLKHGLLAFSAMHIRHTSPACRQPFYTALSRQHLSQALESYIPHLGTNTQQSCPALFALSAVLPSLSYSFLQSEDADLQGPDFIRQFIGVCQFLFGARTVAAEAKHWINDSIVSPMVTLKSLDNVLPQVADGPRIALQMLLDQIQRYSAQNVLNQDYLSGYNTAMGEAERSSVYQRSVELLTSAFPSNTGNPPQLGAVIGWPVFIDQVFFQMLKQNDQMALTILAYYGAALHSWSGFWWLQDIGARLVRAVFLVVDSHFSSLLRWPLSQIPMENLYPEHRAASTDGPSSSDG